jgi:hypothetical protein
MAGELLECTSIGTETVMTNPPNTPCQHTSTRLIAKDGDSQYLECLDCGEILEAGELKDTANFGESLSDA